MDCARAYTELRDRVVDGTREYLSEESLKYFVGTFMSVINSRRRSSYIRNFNDLITILEKRDYVGEANVGPFWQIVNMLPNSGIFKDMISNYLFHRDRPGGSYISHESTAPTFYSQNTSAGSGRCRSSDAITSRNSVLPEAALDCVCKDIGTDWKDLARNLSMREGDIDEIEELYPRKLKERAYECMRRFIKDTDPYQVQQKLLYALDKCGRRDLRENVEEILNRRAY